MSQKTLWGESLCSIANYANRDRGYKTFFMLNSTEHEIFYANKYIDASNSLRWLARKNLQLLVIVIWALSAEVISCSADLSIKKITTWGRNNQLIRILTEVLFEMANGKSACINGVLRVHNTRPHTCSVGPDTILNIHVHKRLICKEFPNTKWAWK